MKDLPLGDSTTCRRESLEPMIHTLEGLCTHSEFIDYAHRVETIKSTYVVCKVIMCPDPYFWYYSINDYEYNNLNKSEAVLTWKKRILK